jgi:hypothetical protein
MEEIRLGMGRPLEVDERGRPVDKVELLRRGRLEVGLWLRQELAAGRRPRGTLSAEERRCLLAAEEPEISRTKPSQSVKESHILLRA